jgi:hypothetical protein
MNRLATFLIKSIGQNKIQKKPSDSLERFGSNYGGWSICTCSKHNINKGLVVSAGVGEDISFDLEILALFNTRIILVDPTTRSKTHIDNLFTRAPIERTAPYSETGCQPIEAYKVTSQMLTNLLFENVALWKDSLGIELFPPNDDNNVSFKIYKSKKISKPVKFFPSIDIPRLLELYEIRKSEITLLKMDIEGSEFAVLVNLLKTSVRPRQIAVEFDFLRQKNILIGILKYALIINRLSRSQYRLIHVEGLNHTFVLEEIND